MQRANGAPLCARCGGGGGGSGLASGAAAAAAAAAAPTPAAAGAARRRLSPPGTGRTPLLPPCRVGVDPSSIQDIIVGGAVSAAVGAALVGGTRKDAEACSLCQATGGARCFACEGTGKREPDGSSSSSSSSRGSSPLSSQGGGEEYDREGGPPRPPPTTLDEMVGGRRTRNPRACRVCGGTGMVLCSQCKGSGYK